MQDLVQNRFLVHETTFRAHSCFSKCCMSTKCCHWLCARRYTSTNNIRLTNCTSWALSIIPTDLHACEIPSKTCYFYFIFFPWPRPVLSSFFVQHRCFQFFPAPVLSFLGALLFPVSLSVSQAKGDVAGLITGREPAREGRCWGAVPAVRQVAACSLPCAALHPPGCCGTWSWSTNLFVPLAVPK